MYRPVPEGVVAAGELVTGIEYFTTLGAFLDDLAMATFARTGHAGGEGFDVAAFWVASAGDETAAGTGFFDDEIGTTVGTDADLFLGFDGTLFNDDVALVITGEVLGVAAIWVACAGKERTSLTKLDDHRLLALLAENVGGKTALDGFHGLGSLLKGWVKTCGEITEKVDPVKLTFGHLVEGIFHASCKTYVHERGEVPREQIADHRTKICGDEMLVHEVRVVAVDERGNNGGIGGWTADTTLFKITHKGGFCVARRRLRELLFLFHGDREELFASFERWKLGSVFALRHDGEKASKKDTFTLGTPFSRATGDGDCGVVEACSSHLGSHKARPDEAVKLILIWWEQVLYAVWGHVDINRTDGFVSVLSRAFCFEKAWFFRVIVLAPCGEDEVMGTLTRFIGDTD